MKTYDQLLYECGYDLAVANIYRLALQHDAPTQLCMEILARMGRCPVLRADLLRPDTAERAA